MDIWDEHPLLFHYTGIEGLKGILESQSLHATHYEFLNDSSEMVFMRPQLAKLVLPGIQRALEHLAQDPKELARIEQLGGMDVCSVEEAEHFVKTWYDLTLGTKLQFQHFEPYITSFCGHTGTYEQENGLLSQWRGYGRETGYALVFECRSLVEAVKRECDQYFYSSGHVGSVVYAGDEKGFNHEFAELIRLVDQLGEVMLRQPNQIDWGPLLHQLLSSIARYKHEGFSEEQEVRVVTSPMSQAFIDQKIREDANFTIENAGKQIKLRHFRANLASYISLCGDEQLPITMIIVGPHVNQDIRQKRLERYLDIKGLKIAVKCSQTPFLAEF